MMTQEEYVRDAIGLLSQLIATPSTSRNEKDAADIMEKALRNYGFTPHREANNVWVIDPHFDEQKPRATRFMVWAATTVEAVCAHYCRHSGC